MSDINEMNKEELIAEIKKLQNEKSEQVSTKEEENTTPLRKVEEEKVNDSKRYKIIVVDIGFSTGKVHEGTEQEIELDSLEDLEDYIKDQDEKSNSVAFPSCRFPSYFFKYIWEFPGEGYTIKRVLSVVSIDKENNEKIIFSSRDRMVSASFRRFIENICKLTRDKKS